MHARSVGLQSGDHFCVLSTVMLPGDAAVHICVPGVELKKPVAQGVHVCAPCMLKVPVVFCCMCMMFVLHMVCHSAQNKNNLTCRARKALRLACSAAHEPERAGRARVARAGAGLCRERRVLARLAGRAERDRRCAHVGVVSACMRKHKISF